MTMSYLARQDKARAAGRGNVLPHYEALWNSDGTFLLMGHEGSKKRGGTNLMRRHTNVKLMPPELKEITALADQHAEVTNCSVLIWQNACKLRPGMFASYEDIEAWLLPERTIYFRVRWLLMPRQANYVFRDGPTFGVEDLQDMYDACAEEEAEHLGRSMIRPMGVIFEPKDRTVEDTSAADIPAEVWRDLSEDTGFPVDPEATATMFREMRVVLNEDYTDGR